MKKVKKVKKGEIPDIHIGDEIIIYRDKKPIYYGVIKK